MNVTVKLLKERQVLYANYANYMYVDHTYIDYAAIHKKISGYGLSLLGGK